MDVKDGKELRPGTAMMGMSALDVASPSVGRGGLLHSLEGNEKGSLEGRKRSAGAGVLCSSTKSPLSLYMLARERLSLY
jgi:hypothetical protein